ncbi:MAG: T9SS type A sorting domain-containing protein [Chitinophagales bacterium]|nr:T9SS type A sorting domain-containing protein [Chitinophagales bacterium]
MKTKIQVLCVIFLCLGQLTAQVTVSISYYNNKAIEPDLWGFHMSNFFESCACYDPEDTSPGPDVDIDLCMQMAANLKPRVLRFPAGGDHTLMHLTDPNGYGLRYEDIEEIEDKGWIIDPDALNKLIYKYNYQEDHYIDIPFLERLVDFVEFCEEENGYAPEIIFVANVVLTKLTDLYSPGEVESENLAAIRYLLDQGVKIVGIEMGNEHYDDRKEVNDKPIFNNPLNPNELYFNSYFQACLPLLDSLDSDPALSGIPISLVAAPEPYHGEAIGHFGGVTASSYKAWNTALKDSAQSLTAGDLFDAYTVHLYNVPSEMPWCYNMYYEDYVLTNPSDPITTSNDDAIVAAWECANDSFRIYTHDTIKAIMNNWAGSCDSCLGNDKPYWMTEWGRFGVEGIEEFESGGVNYTYSGDFANTFIDGAFAFQFLLEMTDYEAGVGSAHLADIDYMIKHNFLSKQLGSTISEPLQLDDDPPSFYRRAKYWPFILMQDIYHKNYERVITSTVKLDGETRTPFLKCFYYDNPWSVNLPSSFCIEEPSGFTSPVFYIYYYNPYPDDITFKHEEMTGWEDDPDHTFNPTSDNAAFMKYVEVGQLYEHGGTNKWMMDNSFYSDEQTPDITGISQEVVDLCNGDSIVLKGYSYGYVYWGITPEPFRLTESGNTTVRVWPNPSDERVYIQLTVSNQLAANYSIVSLTGQVIASGKWPEDGLLQLDRNNAPSGIYLINLLDETGMVLGQQKIVWQ